MIGFHGVVRLHYEPADMKMEDILTGVLRKGKIFFFRDRMDVSENTFLTKRGC